MLTRALQAARPRDPSPPALARYLGNFSPRIVGLRGDEATIARAAADYAVTHSIDHPEGATPDPLAYTVSHSGYVFLIDPSGRQRSAFVSDFTPEEVEHDIRLVLDEER